MKRVLAKAFLDLMGWELATGKPDVPKYVLIAAPHTSNWDFVYMLAMSFILDIDLRWMGKHTLFEPPFATIDATTGELSFECRGRRAPTPITCDLRAADTLAVLEHCSLEFELPGGTYIEYRALESATSRWAVSTRDFRWKVRDGSPFDWLDETAELRWRLSAPGFDPLEGDASAWAAGKFSVALHRASSAR